MSPGDLDGLGSRVTIRFDQAYDSVVILAGLDYLASQNGFPSTLHLVQFLRDTAEEIGGHLLFSFNPATFEKREVTLLEGEGL